MPAISALCCWGCGTLRDPTGPRLPATPHPIIYTFVAAPSWWLTAGTKEFGVFLNSLKENTTHQIIYTCVFWWKSDSGNHARTVPLKGRLEWFGEICIQFSMLPSPWRKTPTHWGLRRLHQAGGNKTSVALVFPGASIFHAGKCCSSHINTFQIPF